jgi:hypothetical protein
MEHKSFVYSDAVDTTLLNNVRIINSVIAEHEVLKQLDFILKPATEHYPSPSLTSHFPEIHLNVISPTSSVSKVYTFQEVSTSSIYLLLLLRHSCNAERN